jgi:hypothetical protein
MRNVSAGRQASKAAQEVSPESLAGCHKRGKLAQQRAKTLARGKKSFNYR